MMDNLTQLLDGTLQTLEAIPFRDLEKLNSSLRIAAYFPKNSRSLATNLRKDLFNIQEPRLLVITAHLYFDYILNRALERESPLSSRMNKSTFATRLQELASKQLVRSEMTSDL